jgi:large subunit ribosomal protein L6
MSRIGRKPIAVPQGVEVNISETNYAVVKGPKGTLEQQLNTLMTFTNENGTITVVRPNDEKETRALHGLTRVLLANMVTGVKDGFKKELNFVGYKASKSGNTVTLGIGYSHPVYFYDGDGITFEVPNETTLIVNGIDKQQVGQVAANVRAKRPPEPYKGKGIKYADEYVRRKAGKAGKK